MVKDSEAWHATVNEVARSGHTASAQKRRLIMGVSFHAVTLWGPAPKFVVQLLSHAQL